MLQTTKSVSSCNIDNSFYQAITTGNEKDAIAYLQDTSKEPITVFFLLELRRSKLSAEVLDLAIKHCCTSITWHNFNSSYLNIVRHDALLLHKITGFYLAQESSQFNHR